MILRVVGAVLVGTALLLTSCAKDSPEPSRPVVLLDGSPRFPDDQGVATGMTAEEITLDGERTYRVSGDLRSFSTSTRDLEPYRKRQGQYVLVGTDGDEVVWIGAVAGVVTRGGVSSTYYTGRLVERRGDDLIFEDGTVLDAGPELTQLELPAFLRVRIDVERHEVVEIL